MQHPCCHCMLPYNVPDWTEILFSAAKDPVVVCFSLRVLHKLKHQTHPSRPCKGSRQRLANCGTSFSACVWLLLGVWLWTANRPCLDA